MPQSAFRPLPPVPSQTPGFAMGKTRRALLGADQRGFTRIERDSLAPPARQAGVHIQNFRSIRAIRVSPRNPRPKKIPAPRGLTCRVELRLPGYGQVSRAACRVVAVDEF